MIRSNLKKNKLIKKFIGEYGNSLILKRKLNILKLFLLRLKVRKIIRINKYKLKTLYNDVYRNKKFWFNWFRKLANFKKQSKSTKKSTKKSNKNIFIEKKKHFRTNVLKFLSISFFDRPIYFRYRTKFCKYFLRRQKFRLLYGFIKVKNFRKIIKKSLKYRNSLDVFMYFIESRLDVILYKLKFTNSIRMSRQLILHGKILVNDKVIRSPNYNLKKKDILTFKNDLISHYKLKLFKDIKKKINIKIRFPNYIEYSLQNLLFKFTLINKYDVRFFLFKVKIHSFISLLNFYNKCLF